MKADPHPLQAKRLRALNSYAILDTDREADFDDIVMLASAICGAPISVINLIDADRQWFKAEVGLGVRETPLATSICSHVILDQGFTEIEDTLLDPRMADNPLCTSDSGLRFYAGALLTTPDGLPLGTLCVLDDHPRSLTPFQRDALRVLARQVMVQLELRKELEASRILRLEVDHRVKNSLQSLSSLARLQLRTLESPEAIDAITAMKSRVDAISALHYTLYQTEISDSLDLASYLGDICANLSKLAPPGVTVKASLLPIPVTSRQAVAVGTLVNELVLNSFKHGYPGDLTGQVLVSTALDGGRVTVICEDDGVGTSPEAFVGSKNLGFTIVKVAAAELETHLRLETKQQGFRAMFDFGQEVR